MSSKIHLREVIKIFSLKQEYIKLIYIPNELNFNEKIKEDIKKYPISQCKIS